MKNWRFVIVGNRSKEEIKDKLDELYEEKEEFFHDRQTPPSWLLKKIEELEKELKQEEEKQKTGNSDNWTSYDEMIKKAQRELEIVKQKESEAESFAKKQQLASARRELEDKIAYYQKQSKVGNIRPNGIEDLTGKNVWVMDKGDEWKVYVLQDKGNKLYVRDQDGHMGWVDIGRVTGLVNKVGNESINAQEWSMFKGLGKDAEKEIGNARHSKEQLLADVRELKKYIEQHKGEDCEKEKRLLGEAMEELDKYYGIIVGNQVVKTIKNLEIDIIKRPGESDWRWYIDDKDGNNLDMGFGYSKEDAIRKAEQKIQSGHFAFATTNKAMNAYKRDAGNGTPGTIASIGPAWSHGGTVYGKMDTDDSGKRHSEYVKITWLGEGKGGLANYFIDDKMQSDKFGSLDKNELKRWAEQKIGNASASQEIRDEYNAEIYRLERKVDELERKGRGFEARKVREEIRKLQRELLELGNKKTTNAAVTLWKGKDSAYVKEDGTVQYLESNSFETDRDKYESQEVAIKELSKKGYAQNNLKRARNAMNKKNPEGLKLKIDDYAEQGLSVEDVVRSLERFGYDKEDIEAQKAYIKQKVSIENK